MDLPDITATPFVEIGIVELLDCYKLTNTGQDSGSVNGPTALADQRLFWVGFIRELEASTALVVEGGPGHSQVVGEPGPGRHQLQPARPLGGVSKLGQLVLHLRLTPSTPPYGHCINNLSHCIVMVLIIIVIV